MFVTFKRVTCDENFDLIVYEMLHDSNLHQSLDVNRRCSKVNFYTDSTTADDYVILTSVKTTFFKPGIVRWV